MTQRRSDALLDADAAQVFLVLVDSENFDFLTAQIDDVSYSFCHQSARDRGNVGYRPSRRIGFIFSDDPEDLKPTITPPEADSAPKHDEVPSSWGGNDLRASETL